MPVLERAQLGQGVPAGPVDEDVLKAPADTGRVGPELRRDACRQLAGHPAHVFQDPAPSPVEVGAVIEDHVDQREAEERVGPHRLDARRREQLGDDRVGDLVLDDVGAAVFPRRVDDHLNVGQVGNGVERRVEDGPTPAGQDRGHEHDDQERIAGAELDDAGDHGSWPLSKDGSLSASCVSGPSPSSLPCPLDRPCPSYRPCPCRACLAAAPSRANRLSESIRKLAEVTTRSPSFSPLRI